MLPLVFLLSTLGWAEQDPQLVRGKRVFEANCVLCHGEKGDGNGRAAQAMKDQKPRDFTKGDYKHGSSKEQLFVTITKGVGNLMPSWSSLSEGDRKDVVAYILSLKK